jgi:hypothetical protein
VSEQRVRILDLSDVEFSAIGRLAAAGGVLEFFLGDAIGRFLGLNGEQIVTLIGGAPYVTKRTWFRAQAMKRLNDDAKKAQLKQILKNADDLMEERNDLVHGLWFVLSHERDGDDKQAPPFRRYRFGRPSEEKPSHRVLTIDQMDGSFRRLRSTIGDLVNFCLENFAEFFP